MSNMYGPVSYTHLDVYKRQVLLESKQMLISKLIFKFTLMILYFENRHPPTFFVETSHFITVRIEMMQLKAS